ncbi:hypothetical protein KQH49_08115 [Mycetohabitans sp. B5]|uniref:Uncharacterized protein n=1 Tax=Mycetohabitans endofungorum TaxID=417203 RepID=A0A2P5KAP6_9BURK|nr:MULTISPECIES: hypothetical protein [Mycetohabitans]MCG1054917.1 hypothetical protein [Mycetohabitans sp. B5]PPB83782.1 hypothetical protein B0O95_106173 [Mycetohabitans endofungorum]
MSITINPFRQARQSDPTPRGNVTTSGNTAAGRERSWHSKFDGLFSRKKKTISTQPPTEKLASTDSKTSQTVRNVAKQLKKAFRPCGSSQSKLIKQFPQVPSRPAPANNRTGVGTKASTQTSTTKGFPSDIKSLERKDPRTHLDVHGADLATRSSGTSSNEAFARVKIGQVNVKKVEFKKVEVEVKTMKAELLSTKTVISEAKKTAKEAMRKNQRGKDNVASKDIEDRTETETELLKKFPTTPAVPAFRPTEDNISSKQTTQAAPPRPPKSDKRPSQRVLLATEKMKTVSLRKKTLIIEGLKTAKKTGRWLPVEPENHAPPTGLSKSNKGSVMD